jgi:hydroxyacylglutathione hydrolase
MPFEKLDLLSVFELKKMRDGNEAINVLDVRRNSEYQKEHIEGAVHIYVGELQNRIDEVPRDKPLAVICSVGRRASIGASLLLRAGFPKVYNVLGGMDAWTSAGFPVTV